MTELGVGSIVAGRYAIRRAIACGGAGAVYEAVHQVTSRPVALKLLLTRTASSPEARQRLLREARALTLARHRNVVAVLDAGRDEDDNPYLAMELLEGRTLAGLLAARRRTSVADTVCLGYQLCEALATAHEQGVIHRDVKPGNLFLALDGDGHEVLKLFDFGIAAFQGDAAEPLDPKLTAHGNILGTPEYMAPEQLLAQDEVDQRSDLYSVGVTLYECLAGAVPFEGTYGRVLLQATTQPLPPLRERCPEAPRELCAVVERALAREPSGRYDGARQLGAALRDAAGVLLGHTSLLGLRAAPAAAALAPATIPAASAGVRPPADTVPPASRQRRRFARVPYITPVTMTRRGRPALYGRSEDISEGGLLVMTAQRCDEAEQVMIRFAVPTTNQFAEARAVARWVRTGRGVGVVGFEFTDLPDAVRAAIRGFVASRADSAAAAGSGPPPRRRPR